MVVRDGFGKERFHFARSGVAPALPPQVGRDWRNRAEAADCLIPMLALKKGIMACLLDRFEVAFAEADQHPDRCG